MAAHGPRRARDADHVERRAQPSRLRVRPRAPARPGRRCRAAIPRRPFARISAAQFGSQSSGSFGDAAAALAQRDASSPSPRAGARRAGRSASGATSAAARGRRRRAAGGLEVAPQRRPEIEQPHRAPFRLLRRAPREPRARVVEPVVVERRLRRVGAASIASEGAVCAGPGAPGPLRSGGVASSARLASAGAALRPTRSGLLRQALRIGEGDEVRSMVPETGLEPALPCGN